MKGKFLNTKNVVIGLVSLVLIGASATGVTVFLKDRGEASAAQEQVQNLPVTGNDNSANQVQNTVNPNENGNNVAGDNTTGIITPVEPTTPGNTTSTTPGTTTRPGTRPSTGETTTGTIEYEGRTIKVSDDLKLSWTTLAIPAITADMGIFKPVLGIEKTATAVVRANQEEQIPVTENNKPMVRAGDTIIYTIKVSNSGNYKATNVVVTDSLDVIFDGKIVPANKELVKIETLDAGKQATLKVGYVVKQEDINAVLETEQNETISKDIINIATATDGKTTVEDEDDMPVNPDVTINVNKNWQDNDNQDGKRAEKITVELYRNDENEPVATATIDASTDWKYVFSKLPKYDENKNEITYKVVEVTVPEYDTEYEISDNGVEIYNHHTPATTEVSGSKTWDDADNQDGKRPESITVRFFADGTEVTSKTVTASDNWSWSFTGLDKYNSGTEIVYTISEDTVADYTTVVDGYNITNTHTPEKISISGSKTWDDADNQDGKRPSNIKVILFADGTEVTSQTVTADNGWKWSFTDLDKYKKGKEIKYTVSEDAVTDYTTEVKGYNITNTHTPEKISISGSKTWDDADNQDGKRPSSIIVNLLADGEKVDSKTVTAENEWNWSFTDLNKYAKGREIQYTITEDKVENYITNIEKTENGYVVTNSYTPETTSISVEKVWNDKNNQDGVRPASIKVKLYMKILDNNIAVANKEPLELNASTFWKAEFKDLPKYAKGIEIKYIVKEVNEQADATIKGTEYKVAYDDPIINENGKYIKITNSYTPKTTSVSVEKVWEDKNNQDGVRPDSINVQLYKTVGTTTTSVEKVKLTNSKLTHTWTELPQYEKGTEIKYTVRELDSNGNPLEDGKQINGKSGTKYTVKYTTDENGKQIITNTYKRVTTSVSGTKTWVDYDNKYNSRPESITINLLANGEKVDSKTITPQNGSWTYEFDEGLPVYKNGQKITYTISEDTVSGYTSNVTGYNVTNTYTEAPKGTITMNWDTQSTTESPIPVDVVFVLDTSWSMTDKGSSRGTNMVKAVNNAIDEILRFNTNNRISVVGYSEYGVLNALKVQYKNTAHSSVLLPLGRYTANDGQNYLKKSERIDRYDSKTGKPIYDYWVETNIQGYAKKTRHFDAGTFTQAGIQKGAEQLTNSTGKTVKVDGKDVQRVPVIIVVSDGEPTVFSTNYTSPLSEKVLGTSQLRNTSAVYGYYTILTANYYKQRVTDAYNTPAKVFTIAMDLTTQYGKTVLNPNNTNVGSCKNWIETDTRNQIEDKEISQKLYKYLNNFKQDISVSCSVGFNKIEENKETKYIVKYENVTVVKNPYSNYSYADKAFADDGMTADDLKRAMIGSITETVSNKKTHNIDENDRKIGKVYLDKIDITKDFKLEIAGGKTYTSYEDAKKDELVGFDGEKYYVDLTKLIGKTVTVNYRQK